MADHLRLSTFIEELPLFLYYGLAESNISPHGPTKVTRGVTYEAPCSVLL